MLASLFKLLLVFPMKLEGVLRRLEDKIMYLKDLNLLSSIYHALNL